jgi:Icc-related predicted phosphoesterase
VAAPSRVPALRLLCVSDTHDLHAQMPHSLPAADILVHAGDFTCQGRREELANFRSWVRQLLRAGTIRHAVVCAGNHETSLTLKARHAAVQRAQQAMKDELAAEPGVTYIEDSACEVLGLRFYGSPWTVPCGRDWAFQEPDTEAGLARRFGAIPSDGIDVLITHQPPLGIGDNGGVGHLGSSTLLQRLEALTTPPLLHVFGHIHAGHGVHTHAPLPATTFVNAAVCDDEYRPVQKPVLVSLQPAPS